MQCVCVCVPTGKLAGEKKIKKRIQGICQLVVETERKKKKDPTVTTLQNKTKKNKTWCRKKNYTTALRSTSMTERPLPPTLQRYADTLKNEGWVLSNPYEAEIMLEILEGFRSGGECISEQDNARKARILYEEMMGLDRHADDDDKKKEKE
jgi:hypothetical protein